MNIGYIGLGKMGMGMVQRMQEKGHEVVAYNRSKEPRERAAAFGIVTVDTLEELVRKTKTPRVFWIMVDHRAVDVILKQLEPLLAKGDIVIDGGNSPYRDSMRRAGDCTDRDIVFLDVGVSGGPSGARNGACLMIGAEESVFQKLELLFRDLALDGGYAHLGGVGSGHYAKMIHNGIEYGMMQSLAEGFQLLAQSPFSLQLEKVADLYNHGSVIESRLMGWLSEAFREHGHDLKGISGSVEQTGEGKWALDEANRQHVPMPVLQDAVRMRTESQKRPNFSGKILSALRNEFGDHDVRDTKS